ncbi:MAG: type II toxin-antitoxin system HicB family antitoxin [Bacteroidales bacterium]|nr:type II toxin-antitoxin system HicB family antitoxin [Bacteroidales bacterium]
MGNLNYKGYSGSVKYSDEDKCFYGTVPGMRHSHIYFEGESVKDLQKDFEAAIDYYLEDCAQRCIEPEKPYSGKLVLRMESDLHGEAAERAAALGISLNEFITRAIKGALAK